MSHWLLAAIAILIIFLGIIYIFSVRKKRRPVDYYNLFIIGIIWAGVGIPLKNFALSAIGIIFMIIGLTHKNEWKKNRKRWKDLNKNERILTIVIMIVLLLLVIAGFILFMLGVF